MSNAPRVCFTLMCKAIRQCMVARARIDQGRADEANHHLAEMCSASQAGSYSRRIDFCITQPDGSHLAVGRDGGVEVLVELLHRLLHYTIMQSKLTLCGCQGSSWTGCE